MEGLFNIWKGKPGSLFWLLYNGAELTTLFNRETWSWDVRTKHVTYEPIPTIEGIRGMANYGPTATLFTIGPQNTVQQYDLDNPAMVANVQHAPVPSRPVASENGRSRTMSPRRLQDPPKIREKGHGRLTPFDANGMDSVSQQRADLISPASSRSRTESVSSKASSGRYKLDRPFSPPSRSGQSATTFSLTSAGGDTPQPSASFQYASSVSMSSVKSSRAASRLRNEVHMSPAEKNIVDLFPFTRARLNDVPFKQAPPLDETHLTPEDLRRQMLNVVFGWEGDIQDLIRDECMFYVSLYAQTVYLLTTHLVSRHAVGSQSAILLARWLGETDSEQMAAMISPGQVTTADWMLLALSQMSGQTQANKVGQAFVQKLLEMGDVHTSASILLGLGDSNDAIEVYVSRNHFMEAILMTCLLMPSDWQRQSYLVRRWGEYVVSHSQQQLAIRCFMCTGAEPTEPWTSPAAQQAASFAEVIRGKSPLASPDPTQSNSNLMLPPNRPRSASNQRPAGKTPALKLITSFDSQPNQRFRFPGLKSDDRTPTNAPGVTPIAESAVADSALSPGGLGSWKLNNIQSLSQAMTSRSGTPAWNRRRLPSIGETPVDVHPPTISRSGSYQTSGHGSTSENDETSGHDHSQDEQGGDDALLLSASRYNPEVNSLKPSPQTAVQAADRFASIKGLPSPGPGLIEALRENSDIRNGSRDRKPDGLQIELVHTEESHAGSHDQSDLLPIPSAKSTTSTLNSYSSAKSPSVSGRSIDQYISSLEEANYHSKKPRSHRSHGRERRNTDETASQSSRTHHPRDRSQESRGRNERRYIQPAKRSPSSPIPMSPEELARYHTGEPDKAEASRKTQSRARSSSKMRKGESRSRQRSSSRNAAAQIGGDKNDPSSRGRSVDRQSSTVRSPSSPLPMSLPSLDVSQQENGDNPLRIVAGNQKRLRSRHRSASRRRGVSSRRDPSTESKSGHKVSYSQPEIRQVPKAQNPAGPQGLELLSAKTFGQEDVFANTMNQQNADSNDEAQDLVSPTTPFVSLAERKRREVAAAELEARRLSLARNPSAPNIPFPGELQSGRPPVESPPPFHGNSYFPRVPSRNKIPPSKNSPEYQSSSDSSSSRSGMPVGLPATPRAMRHPKYGGGHEEERPPSVPALPTDNFGSLLLTDARYQGEAERIGRSMSVPVPQGQHYRGAPVPSNVPMHPRFNPNLPRSRSNSRSRMSHRRTSSGGYASGTSPHVTVSIEETIDNAMQYRPSAPQIDLIPPPPPPPPILPELQHLKNTPPPPPPAPFHEAVSPRESSATIDIAIDNHDMGHLLPRAMTAAPALTSTESRQTVGRRMSFDHRRNRSSNESFTNKLRSLTRMRSNSRSVEPWTSHHDTEMPYEGVHSHGHFSTSQGPAYVKGDLTSFL